jgi:hypothetical protein
MSNRHLAAGAAVVWAIAVLVGVFIAAPLWFGFDVDAGLIVNALAALGAFAAAAAAVWVATSDRRERMRERDAEDEAQAALMIVEPVSRGSENEKQLEVIVKNFGKFPVLDVTLVELIVGGHPQLRPSPRPRTWPVLEPTRAKAEGLTFVFPALRSSRVSRSDETDLFRLALYGKTKKGGESYGWLQKPTIDQNTTLTATVRFRDANGNWWETTYSGTAEWKSRADHSVGCTRQISLMKL